VPGAFICEDRRLLMAAAKNITKAKAKAGPKKTLSPPKSKPIPDNPAALALLARARDRR
jgi:hypothetical protein